MGNDKSTPKRSSHQNNPNSKNQFSQLMSKISKLESKQSDIAKDIKAVKDNIQTTKQTKQIKQFKDTKTQFEQQLQHIFKQAKQQMQAQQSKQTKEKQVKKQVKKNKEDKQTKQTNQAKIHISIFFQKIIEKVSTKYMQFSTDILARLDNQQISTDQAKLQISQKILQLNLTILRVIGKSNDYNYDINTLEELNKFQHDLIGYLIEKYPRGAKTFVSSTLINKFFEFDKTNDFEFDILKRSNTYFGDTDDKSIMKNIKLFINKVMHQCDEWFPIFQKLMNEKIFKTTFEIQKTKSNEKNQQVNLINEKLYPQNKKQLKFKIGRKIPENVPRYQKLQTQTLQIQSSQILRVLIKWIQGLEQIIKNPKQNVLKSQTLKVYLPRQINQKDSRNKQKPQINCLSFFSLNNKEHNKKDNKEDNKIQQQQIHNFRQKVPSQIYNDNQQIMKKFATTQKQFQQKNKQLLNQLNECNIKILKLIFTNKREQKYVSIQETQVIKYSTFNVKFIEYLVTQKLVFAIKQLIDIGKQIKTKDSQFFDLIKFNVTDLMRCSVQGNKDQIKQIYNNFIQLDKKGTIKIIKMKNRFKTNLNDVMIMFTITNQNYHKKKKFQLINSKNNLKSQQKQSWIICQAQLIFSQTGNKTDEKSKNMNDLNHFFYELNRSPHGILPQIAQRLVYKDSKLNYEKNLTFKQNQFDIQKFKQQHQQDLTEISEQRVPFICSKCSRFYNKNQNLFKFYKFKQMNIQFCINCIQKTNSKFKQQLIMVNIQKQLQIKINQAEYSNIKDQKQTNNIQTLKQKISSIKKIFNQKKFKLKDMFKKQNKIEVSQLMQKLKQQFKIQNNAQNNFIFMIVNFFNRKAQFKWYSYNLKREIIENIMDYTEKYQFNSKFQFTDYDMVFQINQGNVERCYSKCKSKHILIFNKYKQIQNKIQHIQKKMVSQTINIISYKRQNLQFHIFLGYEYSRYARQRPFKNKQYNQIKNKYQQLSFYRQNLQLKEIGIQDKQLNLLFGKKQWLYNIKKLNLQQNNIEDISIILQNCINLKIFQFSQNNVKQLIFIKELKRLKYLSGFRNKINKIKGLTYINQINQIYLSQNQIQQFPVQDKGLLKALQILDLQENKINKLKNILKCKFQCLYQLNIANQRIQFFKIEYNEEQNDNQMNKIQINKQTEQKCFNISQKINSMKNLICQSNQTIFQTHLSEKDQIYKYKDNQFAIQFKKLKIFKCCKDNQLMKNKQIIFKSKQIEEISIKQCQINNIRFIYKQSFQKLKSLNLTMNSIKNLNFFKFSLNNQKQKHTQSLQDQNIIINYSLVYLFLDYNRIQQIPILNFYKLKILQLDRNQIKNLSSLSKSNMPQLQYLNLSKNKLLNEIVPLNFNKLKQLYIFGLKQLKNVDKLFTNQSHLESLQKLDLSYTQNNDFSFNINKKNNKLANLKQISFQNNQFSADITQQTLLQIQSLQNINLKFCVFKQFPKMILSKIKQLYLQYVSTLNLKNLQNCQFNSLQSLQLYKVTDKIYQILSNDEPQKDKQHNINKKQQQEYQKQIKINKQQINYNSYFNWKINFPSLKKLQFSDSQFVSIKGLQNSNLQKLQQLYIEQIKLIDQTSPKISFHNLYGLDVKKLKINDLDDFLDQKCINLKYVTLNCCKIQKISDQMISRWQKLQLLNLENNLITAFKCTKQLNNLKKFNINKNKLIRFPQIKAKNLQQFVASDNYLLTQQNCFKQQQQRIQFKADDKKMQNIQILGKMPKLQLIQINDCNLKSIKWLTQFADNFPNIKKLSFFINKIEQIPLNIKNLKSLNYLNLCQNPIKNINLLQSLTTLQLIKTLQISLDVDENQYKALRDKIKLKYPFAFVWKYEKIIRQN